jgi:CheY-like chemotaxis protein
MSSCRNCGLGLSVTRASRAIKLQFQPERDARSSGSHPRIQMPTTRSMAAISASVAATERAAGRSVGKPVIKKPVKQMRRVFLVEDSTFLREVTRDLLTERMLAREVIGAPDGQAFIEAYARDTAAGQKPDLIVLDVRMPGIDGREAAFAIRAVEKALSVKPTPILFFSSVICDDTFKAQLRDLGSARYIRKSQDGDETALGNRIVSVLERLVGVGQ